MMDTSTKPYLIRALYEWLIDNHLTPYLLVNANYPGVVVPEKHIQQGRIILNISPSACRGLHLENDRIIFTTRFSGETMQIFLPPASVLAIYAKENGKGMEFGEEAPPAKIEDKAPSSTQRKKPSLTLIKKDEHDKKD